MNQAAKQQLLEKTKELLSQVRDISVDEVVMIDLALNAKEIDDQDLQEIHDALAEYKHEQDSAYQDFKENMVKAMGDYAKKLNDIKNSTQNT